MHYFHMGHIFCLFPGTPTKGIVNSKKAQMYKDKQNAGVGWALRELSYADGQKTCIHKPEKAKPTCLQHRMLEKTEALHQQNPRVVQEAGEVLSRVRGESRGGRWQGRLTNVCVMGSEPPAPFPTPAANQLSSSRKVHTSISGLKSRETGQRHGERQVLSFVEPPKPLTLVHKLWRPHTQNFQPASGASPSLASRQPKITRPETRVSKHEKEGPN